LADQSSDYTLQYGNGDPVRNDKQDSRNKSVYLEDTVRFNNVLTLRPGIRYDMYDMNTSTNNDSYSEFSYGLAGELELSEQLTLLASRTELFKGPELSEIFVGAGIGNEPNPDLKPESGHNDEVGLQFVTYDSSLANVMTARVNFFRTTLENKIEEVDYPFDDCVGRGCAGWYDNTGEVEIDGFEASLSLGWNRVNTLISYARSDSRVVETNEPLEREVGDSIALNVDYALPVSNMSLSWTSQVILDEESSDNTKVGFDVHNVSLRWQPETMPGLDLTFGVDNLFDELYSSHASRAGRFYYAASGPVPIDDFEPGRNIKATASYRF
jgi:hemoglobin/transferrin/lactoferrin receptor protein